MTKLTEGEQDHVLDRYNELKDYLNDLYIRGKLEQSEIEYRDSELLQVLDLCADKTYKLVMKKVLEIRNTLSMYEEDEISI